MDEANPRVFVKYRNGEPEGRVRLECGPAVPGGVPVISILIPTSDGHRFGYLPRLLGQIRSQTFPEYEIIIVEGDRRQGRAINTAAGIARGRVLVTFDDDTRLGNEHVLANLLTALDSDERIGMVGGANTVPDDAPWLVRRVMLEVPRRSSPPVTAITDSDMAEHPCLAMRKDVFYAVGGEHEVIPRGLDPYLRRAFREAGYRVVVAPGIVYHHLPPPTMKALLKQFYRNGRMSALVSRQFPELALDNALEHNSGPQRARSRSYRAVRFAGRLLCAAGRMHLVCVVLLLAYAWGVLSGSAIGRRLSNPTF